MHFLETLGKMQSDESFMLRNILWEKNIEKLDSILYTFQPEVFMKKVFGKETILNFHFSYPIFSKFVALKCFISFLLVKVLL